MYILCKFAILWPGPYWITWQMNEFSRKKKSICQNGSLFKHIFFVILTWSNSLWQIIYTKWQRGIDTHKLSSRDDTRYSIVDSKSGFSTKNTFKKVCLPTFTQNARKSLFKHLFEIMTWSINNFQSSPLFITSNCIGPCKVCKVQDLYCLANCQYTEMSELLWHYFSWVHKKKKKTADGWTSFRFHFSYFI